MKTCNLCREDKPSEAFSKCSAREDGLQNYCKLCASDKRKARYEANKEAEREQNRKWFQDNRPWERPERKEYLRAWMDENRERSNYTKALRKHKIRAGGGSIDLVDWLALCDEYGNKCLRCGKPEVTMDHVVPISKGGAHSIDNLQPLCGSCNSSKGARTIDYRSNRENNGSG
jgi:5-methylcytosine-specific restriction endonuclease McrA